MKHFHVYGVFISVIDPTDYVVLGMIDVKKLQRMSFTLYLYSHQIRVSLTAQRHGLWQFLVA
jgi:hypothetical protein